MQRDDADLLHNEPGWLGTFTRATAEGAMPNKTRVVKQNSEPGDSHPDGTPGVILGSMSHPAVFNGVVFYFVEWASTPRVASGTAARKVRKAE